MGTNDRYLTLDAMRGVAALMVATLHLSLGAKVHLGHAYLAVDFFFMLSGFVIAQAYEDRLRSDMTFAAFAWRRFCRLWPLFFLAVVIGLAYAVTHASDLRTLANAALNSLMLPGPFTNELGHIYPANPPAWSLFFELIANAAYGLFAARLRTRWLVAAVAAAAAGLVWLALHHRGNVNFGVSWPQTPGALLRVTFGFTLGVLIYRLAQPKVRRASVLAVALGASLILLFAFGSNRYATDLLFLFAGAPLLVILGSRFEPPRWLRGFAGWLGAVSYALYVLHVPLLRWMQTLVEPDMDWRIRTAVFVLGALAAATVADRLFDSVVRRRLAGPQLRAGSAPGQIRTADRAG